MLSEHGCSLTFKNFPSLKRSKLACRLVVKPFLTRMVVCIFLLVSDQPVSIRYLSISSAVSNVLHLWEFMRDLLLAPEYGHIIEWISKKDGVFRVVNSSEVARLWGEKKNNKKKMTYEKLSRSLRWAVEQSVRDKVIYILGETWQSIWIPMYLDK